MNMTMIDYYNMTLSAECELRDTVEAEGEKIGETFNSNTYRHNDLIKYNGDIYQIDCILGIVDVNDTAGDLDRVLFN